MNLPSSTTRILLVDGQRFTQAIIANMLRSLGFTDITLASSAVQALTIMQNGETDGFDLVVLNQTLPDFEGTDVLKMIRDGRVGIPAGTKVLILSAISEEKVVRTAFAHGVDGFLMMPLSMATLGRRIYRMLDPAQATDAA